MRTTDLSELAAFDAVARHKSFKRAAEERGVTASAISHAVSNLESRTGIRLLNRTTRNVSLTDAGIMLLTKLSPAFDNISAALDSLNNFRDTPYGKVRLNVPNSLAAFILGKVVGPLTQKNPNLEIEITATDRVVDIVEGGFDAGIRLGESLDETVIAVKIKPRMRMAVVGSPEYFKTHKKPTHPDELKNHTCIQNMYPSGTRYNWDFEKGDKKISHHPTAPIALDDHALMLQVALSGAALAYVWEDHATDAIKNGKLIRCLDSWCPPEDWLYIYYPSRRHLSAGLRTVIDALKAF